LLTRPHRLRLIAACEREFERRREQSRRLFFLRALGMARLTEQQVCPERFESEGSSRQSAGLTSRKQQEAHKRASKARSGRRVGMPCHKRRRAYLKPLPGEKLTALLRHITVDTLRSSFLSLKKRAAICVDQFRWVDFAADLDLNLTDLRARVHSGAHRAVPS
jgi:hypothetical protein